jgi:glyoxylase-like metal-dependent hydrolase (beta-lactamase superfamily II)
MTTTLAPLVETLTVGRLRIHTIQAGGQKLDGGAMFGVVPKPLWERRIAPDERNRIQLGMRCLLIEHESTLVLVDTGAGNKETSKFHDIYGLENAGANGRTLLEDGLSQIGVRPEDIGIVIDTHLHFDHAGGNTRRGEDGSPVLAFPNARYVVRRGEWDWAHHPNERTAASYFAHNYDPVHAADRLELVDDDRDVLPGISLRRTPGHTPHHQGILVESDGERLFYLADLAPTAAHVPLPWIMAYDVEPLVTLETKRRVWAEAAAEGWTVMFEHDATNAFGRIVADGRGYGCEVLGAT